MKYSERKKLKAQAHHLNPVIKIGKFGLTEALIKATDKALSDHELIKVKFVDFKEERRELSEKLAEQTESIFIGMIGNVLILYKEKPEEEVS